jgi:hypothetical protein
MDAGDAIRAKEILGGHTGIMVICPNSSRVWLLARLESFLKDIMDKCGANRGLILAVLIPNNAKMEDVQAILKSVKEHGRY